MFKRILIIIIMLMIGNNINTHYIVNGIVTNVNGTKCTITDESNNEWIYISNNLKPGLKVKMYMNTNHTNSTIYDDIIEKVK